MRDNGLRTIAYKNRGARALLCIALGVLILALSLHMQRRMGVAVFSHPSPNGVSTAAPDGGAYEKCELELSAHSWYTLQLGAFTQENAALQLAQEFTQRGAAGFVYFDGEAYRVLAAAYPTRAEAQSVQTRLNAQNVGTYIHPFEQEQLTLRAGGTKGQLQALAETLAYLDALDGKFYALSSSLDAREMEGGEARAALLSESATCEILDQRLRAAFQDDLPAPLESVSRALRAVGEEGEALGEESGAARVGAALKRCQLTAFFALTALTDALSV